MLNPHNELARRGGSEMRDEGDSKFGVRSSEHFGSQATSPIPCFTPRPVPSSKSNNSPFTIPTTSHELRHARPAFPAHLAGLLSDMPIQQSSCQDQGFTR